MAELLQDWPAGGLSPRVRGNPFAYAHIWQAEIHGLSPRVRGNPLTRIQHHPPPGRRSIPARAGEPAIGTYASLATSRVYPRACGGTGTGNGQRPAPGHRVYPRACGGTPSSSTEYSYSHCHQRSIPARAGEPPGPTSRHWAQFVGSIPARAGEPAGCQSATDSAHPRGLSPRVRGNHDQGRWLPGPPGYPRPHDGR